MDGFALGQELPTYFSDVSFSTASAHDLNQHHGGEGRDAHVSASPSLCTSLGLSTFSLYNSSFFQASTPAGTPGRAASAKRRTDLRRALLDAKLRPLTTADLASPRPRGARAETQATALAAPSPAWRGGDAPPAPAGWRVGALGVCDDGLCWAHAFLRQARTRSCASMDKENYYSGGAGEAAKQGAGQGRACADESQCGPSVQRLGEARLGEAREARLASLSDAIAQCDALLLLLDKYQLVP